MQIVQNKIELKTELQDPISYSKWIVVLVGVILVTSFIIYILWLAGVFKRRQKKVTNKAIAKPRIIKNPLAIKSKYLSYLDNLEKAVRANSIGTRDAYLKLSEIVRKYAFEATGIKVHNYTLNEIQSLNMPQLTSLISVFYEPEFAYESQSDILNGITSTRKVIVEWN